MAVSEKQTGSRRKLPQPMVDVAIAFVLVASIFLVMFAYTASWPPLVVVESKSMQHSDTESSIGVMDTGDLAMVKKVSDVESIKSYVAGIQEGYRTYGDYGDVVIYWRGGDQSKTPIIHRAVIYLVANGNGSYSAPELKGLTRGTDYDFDLESNSWSYITEDLRLHGYGYRGMELLLPVGDMLAFMHSRGVAAHDGFVTKGDGNQAVDQLMFTDSKEPVPFEWVHGVATGEIPWFGIIKLFLTGTLPFDTPGNSIMFLWMSIAVIAAVPIGGEVYNWWKGKKVSDADERPEGRSDAKADEKTEPTDTPAPEPPVEKK